MKKKIKKCVNKNDYIYYNILIISILYNNNIFTLVYKTGVKCLHFFSNLFIKTLIICTK